MSVLAEAGHVVIWAVVFWVVSHTLDAVWGRVKKIRVPGNSGCNESH